MARETPHIRPIDILLVEDNPGDADLVLEALEFSKLHNTVHIVSDGEKAMHFLRREGPYAKVPRPDLILLDLNLPRKDGREVLAEIKGDDDLRIIPVVILTTSKADEDVLKAYQLHANCYIPKPFDFTQLVTIVRSIEDFWLSIVLLPKKEHP
jgi:two-component system response regulator